MYLVSACLAGVNCRHDAKNKINDKIKNLVDSGQAIIACPEELGGLSTPRVPCEMILNKVVSKIGVDCTKEFNLGANKTLEIAKNNGVNKAILKSKSPSCGYGVVYDGTFLGNLVSGNGLTADLLSKNGIEIFNEENFDEI
jgi:uncharacterized protein YbbK (DUF523 family)